MWNSANRDLCDRFGSGKTLPSDTDYGTYIAKELMALGYAPKQLHLAAQAAFIAAMPVLGGMTEAMLICKPIAGTVNQGVARSLMSMRSMHRAGRYIVITTGKLDLPALQLLNANGLPSVDQFNIGDDVLKILGKAGLVPEVMLSLLSKNTKRMMELDQKLRSTEQALVYQEEQATIAMAGGGGPAKKTPDQMSPMEKFKAGMMDPYLGQAMRVISGTNAVTTGSLMKRLKCSQAKADLLLNQMEQLGVVTPAKIGSPRFVKMTKGMMEKQFHLSDLPMPEFLS